MLYVWTIHVRNIDKLEIIIIMIIDIHMTHRLAIYHLYTQWTHHKGSFTLMQGHQWDVRLAGPALYKVFKCFQLVHYHELFTVMI